VQFKLPKIVSLVKGQQRSIDATGKLVVQETLYAHQIERVLLGSKRPRPYDVIICTCEQQFARSEFSEHQTEQICQALLMENYNIIRTWERVG
jgi:hypothetical protein